MVLKRRASRSRVYPGSVDRAYDLGVSGEDAASRLLAASQLGNHFEPVFVLATSPITFVELRRRLISRADSLIRLLPSPDIFADLERLAEKDGETGRRVIWLELATWNEAAWKETLVVLNRLRDPLHERFSWLLIFAGPLFEGPGNLANLCARHAPDFYSIATLLLIKERPVPFGVGASAGNQIPTRAAGPNDFELRLTIHRDGELAELSLRNAEGEELAWHLVFSSVLSSILDSFFELTSSLEEQAIIKMGAIIAAQLLGPEIFPTLAESNAPRTLQILLPSIEHSEKQLLLAAALARVPWELARHNAEAEALMDRNLMVRLLPPGPMNRARVLEFRPDEELRVLLVFSDPQGRLNLEEEQRGLLSFFAREDLPKRRVVVDSLIYGVTREHLFEQIRSRSGYHLVHWSGLGGPNQLDLERPTGQKGAFTADLFTGHDLLELFLDAFAALPLFFFLSTSQSGALNFQSDAGTTGTAYALVQGGVTTVVAMRSELTDKFARELALLFYQLLFDETKSLSVAEALLLARKTLAAHNERLWDYAAPVVFGEDLHLPPRHLGP